MTNRQKAIAHAKACWQFHHYNGRHLRTDWDDSLFTVDLQDGTWHWVWTGVIPEALANPKGLLHRQWTVELTQSGKLRTAFDQSATYE